jgi:ribosomal protein S18 acetylase RimI-like enzyme
VFIPTNTVIYRFLREEDFSKLLDAFNQAFSDYLIPVILTESQFETFFIQRQIDIKRSLGVFVDDEMIAFTINGFGIWNEVDTVYDAGTGVIPVFRKQRVAEKMFEFMIPHFQKQGIKQYLLEVVTTNQKALGLYKKLGFEIIREVSLLKAEKPLETNISLNNKVNIYEMKDYNWNLLTTFWDAMPTWQNSIKAVDATIPAKIYLGAFLENKCIGYIVFSANAGVIAQIAVDKNHRRQGVGLALLTQMQMIVGREKKISVMNLDLEIKSTLEFFERRGFCEILSQFEMVKTL